MSAGPEPATVKDENVRGYARGVRPAGRRGLVGGDTMANTAPEFTESGSITRISTDAAGGQGNSDSYGPVFSPDGTKVAFYSYASNLVPGDGNGAGDIFVKDLTTGVITRISTDASGAQADGFSYEPVFSPDGTKVAFSSGASNLVPGDTNGAHDIFVKDLTTGVVTRVSTDATGAQANGYSYWPVFSPDGTKVAFYSFASTLVPGDNNSASDIFVKDLITGAVTRVSTDVSGTQGNSGSYLPVFSPDGTKVAFFSDASNLVPGDTNSATDVFVKDLTTGAVTRVSTDAGGIQANGYSYSPVFSPDGTKVAFYSAASNLAPGDTNGSYDIFVKDLTTGAITRVSTDAGGIQANSSSYIPTFSPDGTKLAFYSYATNLVPGDTNNTPDVFVKDLTTGIVTRLSTDAAGAQGNGYSDSPVFSPDGNKVVFNSGAPNLVPDDTNYTTDIFVKDLSVAKATLTDAAAKSALTGAGKIFFADADAGDSHTVSIAPQAGALGTLTVVVVPVAGGASHVDWSYSVDTALIAALGTGQSRTETFTLTLDDGQGGTATRDVTVTLNGIDDAPVFTSPATVSFAEAATGPVLQVAAQDPEGAALTYALSGADAALFDLAADGILTFKSAPDYEAPADAGADNIYNVTITASDGALSTAQDVAVSVTDVGENAPQWASVGGITRVSTTSTGAQANSTSSEGVLSADGTKLYFVSGASNLVPGSTGNVADLYVKDLATGQTTRLLNDCGAYDLSLSPDGTKIAFASQATNLVGNDTNGQYDIFVLNLTNGAVTRITSASGAEGTGGNALGYYNPTFTSDSSKVVYSSGFSNLVSGDTNNIPDIFVTDLNTGAISRISTNGSGQEAIGVQNNYFGSHDAVVSPDGTKIVFWSYATNLVSGDTNGQSDVFLKDLTTGAVTLLSTSAAGAPGNYGSQGGVFSPDGTKVAFYSSATNLMPGISNSGIYIKDIQTGAIEFVAPSTYSLMAYSPDGTKLAFISSSSNLVEGDTNAKNDVFVKDLATGQITRVSTSADGVEANGLLGASLAFTPDGKSVVFSSYASNLVPGDTNAAMDIFIKDATPPTVSSAIVTDAAAKSSLTAAGRFYFTDADANDIHTVSVAPQAGALGSVTASVVPRADGPDRIDWSYSIDSALVASLGAGQSRTETFALSLSDGTPGGTITQTVTVTVNGIDDAPAFSSPAAVTVSENSGGAVLKVVATDPEGLPVSYTLSGTDAALFNFAPDGTLSFKAPPNFEAPGDAGANNVYDLLVTATDGTQSGTQAITVTVGDVVETGNAAPQFLDGKPGGGITRVSTTATGAQVSNDSLKPEFSPDGTKVVFYSGSNAYVPGDTNGNYDVFIKDLATGAVSLVSTTSSGAPAIGGSTDAVFSPDGTKVAFASSASNLVDGDGNGSADIFVKDLATGAVTLVSGTDTGGFGTSNSREPRFSPDGTKVAFISSSALTASDTDGSEDLYIRDLSTGELTLVTEGNSYVSDSSERDFSFAPDGTKIVFVDGSGRVTVKDLTTGALSVVSTNAAGGAANDYLNLDPVFSPDGTKVAFSSRASNLVPNDTNNSVDVFVKDLVTGEITRVSTSASGVAGNNSSEQPQFSPDGTKILFRSNAKNLVPGSQSGANFYIKDLITGDVERVSSSAANVQLGYTDMHASFSADGTSVIFTSYAQSLVPGDTNSAQDIFIKELGDESVTSRSLTEAGGAQGLAAEGRIYFSDSDAGDTHTVSITPQAGTLGTLTAIVVDRPSGPDRVDWNYTIDQAQFSGLQGGETRVEVFTLTLDDGHGNSTTQSVSVTLTNINDAPVITAPTAAGFEENGSGLVLQVSATDADGDALTYGISGTDAALFEMSADGKLTFKSPPNFEAPADAGGENVYDLILTASDGALTTQQELAVTVTDFAEPPSVLIGDAGANTLNGTAGADGIWAGAGNDTLNGGGGDDLLFGDDGDDKLYGGSGNDTLTGGTGNDYLDGGSGNDALVGGSGNDTYVVDAAGDVVVEAAGGGIDTVRTSRSSYALGDEVESLVFTGAGNFTGTGNALANAITGGAGNDTLDGGAGNDTLIGGAGNDTYVVDAAGDVIVEAAGGGTADQVRAAVASFTLGAELENLTFIGTGDFAGTGNALANTLKGGTGNDALAGGSGNDTLYGLSGDDTLDGGTGADTLIGGSGNDTYLVDSALDVITEYSGGGTDTVRATASSYTLSAEVEALTFVGTGAFTGTGNASANIITGGSGNDTLDGGDGADTLIGGSGSDSLIGGAGNDTLDGGTGNDTLTGGAGNDTYVVDSAGDVLVEAAGGGTDTVRTTRATYTLGAELENLTFIGTGSFTGTGNAANNVIIGGAGNDTLDGGAGNDTLIGGLGNDTYVVDTGDSVSEAADGGTDLVKTALAAYTLGNNVENLTYTGTAAFTGTGNTLANTLKGGAGHDVLSGGSGNDTLYGLTGNDTLDGGSGADTLIGGSGDDTYVVDNSGDVVSEYAVGGTDTVRTALATYTLASEVENLTFTGSAGFTGTGNSLGNVITGGSGNDTLDGKAGNDTLIGGAGNDTYVVDAAGDVVVEAAGGGTADQVRTGLSAYTLGAEVENLTYTGTTDFAGTGNDLANTLKGGTGHDVLTGGAGNDTLYGLSGNDTLDGGTGADTLIGGSGNDTYQVDSALDVITEYSGGGTDTALSTASSVTLAAEVENLTFAGAGDFTGTGNGLANILAGGSGNDLLNGAAGNDTLIGGLGADALTGGTGADVFVYTDAAQSGAGLFDTIADFSAGEGDLIDLSAIDANAVGGTADDAFIYVGAAAFSGTAGELRFSGGQLQGDTNGDGTADLLIALNNTTTLSAGSIRL